MKTIGKPSQVSFKSWRNKVARLWPLTVYVAAIHGVAVAEASAGEINGTAYEKGGPNPVKGVIVDLYRENALVDSKNTGKDGHYTVQFTKPGQYRINFTKPLYKCIAPYVDESIVEADVKKRHDVWVYPETAEVTQEELLKVVQLHAATSDSPGQAVNDLAALSTAGYDSNILKQVAAALAKESPSLATPMTGTLESIQDGVASVYTEHNAQPSQFKISDATAFIDGSGKKVSPAKAMNTLVGAPVTVFPDASSGDKWTAKSVVAEKPIFQ